MKKRFHYCDCCCERKKKGGEKSENFLRRTHSLTTLDGRLTMPHHCSQSRRNRTKMKRENKVRHLLHDEEFNPVCLRHGYLVNRQISPTELFSHSFLLSSRRRKEKQKRGEKRANCKWTVRNLDGSKTATWTGHNTGTRTGIVVIYREDNIMLMYRVYRTPIIGLANAITFWIPSPLVTVFDLPLPLVFGVLLFRFLALQYQVYHEESSASVPFLFGFLGTSTVSVV